MSQRVTDKPDVMAAWTAAQTDDFPTMREVFAAAKARLDPAVWDFLEGGAGDEITLRRNRQAFNRWEFRTRNLSGNWSPNTDTTFMGVELGLPILTAPFGVDGLFDPDGHLAVARANQRMGSASIVPEVSTFALEQVAAEAPRAARFMQLHPTGAEANFLRMVERAEAAGFSALCLTIDCPTAGWRERNFRNRYFPPPEVALGNYAGRAGDPAGVIVQLFTQEGGTWSWSKLEHAIAQIKLPVMLKGVLTKQDATFAREVGAKAVLVSNHGGRQLDGAPASLDQLPEIVAAVGGELEIALDSGIRRGSDILKALALGASVVVCGRVPAMGLAAAGESGVARVLELLRDELVNAMMLVGVPEVRGVAERGILQESRWPVVGQPDLL